MKKLTGYVDDYTLMLTPTVLILGLVTIIPFFYMVSVSFTNLSLPQFRPLKLVGFKNWIHFVRDSSVMHSWMISAIYIGCGIFIELTLGIIIALIIHSLRKTQELIVTLCILPLFLAPVVVGLLWRYLVHESYGLYAYLLNSAGLFQNTSILGNQGTALASIIIMDVWEWTPLIILIVLGGLKTLPAEPFEAAVLDGISPLRMIRHITLPMLKPTITIAVLIRTMDILRDYTKVIITTGGGPADATKDISLRLADVALVFFDLGYASVIALTILVVIIILAKSFLGFFYKKS